MLKKSLTPAILFIALLSLLLASGNNLSANQTVITDDGRKVLLKNNGSWTFHTTDRFASTADGRRVRLKEDGRWEYANDAPAAPEGKTQTSNPLVKLQKVVIEKHVKKGYKNTRVKTQTVFYVQLKAPQQTAATINNSDASLIEVTDNNGKSYPVLSIKPGTAGSVIIRANKSPTILDDARSMQITLKAGAFNIKRPITLRMRIVDFDKKDVNGFE